MKTGLTFGKYLPFHTGHKALLDFALERCDHLKVVVCASDGERFPADHRARWIRDAYPGLDRLEIIPLDYKEQDLPNTSESSREVAEVWSARFLEMLPRVDLVFTSEPYGDFVAEYMQLTHVPFDPSRLRHPISASRIRADIPRHWCYIMPSVRRDLGFRVVIHGTESTGKTTLVRHLADVFGGTPILEAGRDVIPDSGSFAFDDLAEVVRVHSEWIAAAGFDQSPFLFIDTNLFTTESYARHFYGRGLAWTPEVESLHRAHLDLYLNREVPFVQDGTRLQLEERDALDGSHRSVLDEFGVQIAELSGTHTERSRDAVQLVRGKAQAHFSRCFQPVAG